jgi:isoleucyl-tRNA synthetase
MKAIVHVEHGWLPSLSPESVTQAYDAYNFGKVFQLVSSFQHLVSALYVDVCKGTPARSFALLA